VLDKLIGRGKFGEVKLGEWWGTKVAVKYLHNFDLKENAALFQKEINVMKELHHPHIVQFLGWSQGGALARGAPVILMEYLSNGSVEDYLLLHGSRVGLSLRTRWALQMAQALAFLHNRKPNYLIHRKLAPQPPPPFFLRPILCIAFARPCVSPFSDLFCREPVNHLLPFSKLV
jgi:serine/threonine protein kinase